MTENLEWTRLHFIFAHEPPDFWIKNNRKILLPLLWWEYVDNLFFVLQSELHAIAHKTMGFRLCREVYILVFSPRRVASWAGQFNFGISVSSSENDQRNTIPMAPKKFKWQNAYESPSSLQHLQLLSIY